jgi:hypothetical protein
LYAKFRLHDAIGEWKSGAWMMRSRQSGQERPVATSCWKNWQDEYYRVVRWQAGSMASLMKMPTMTTTPF